MRVSVGRQASLPWPRYERAPTRGRLSTKETDRPTEEKKSMRVTLNTSEHDVEQSIPCRPIIVRKVRSGTICPI